MRMSVARDGLTERILDSIDSLGSTKEKKDEMHCTSSFSL